MTEEAIVYLLGRRDERDDISQTYLGWGGVVRTLDAPLDLGFGTTRNVPNYGVRRAVWDAAFGYVSGFRKRDIVYFLLTRSLSSRVERWALRREGYEFE